MIKYGEIGELINNELINRIENANNIVVYGMPKSGKTLIAELIQKKLTQFTLIESDDYIKNGWLQGMYDMHDVIVANPKKYIAFGVQAGRLLRHGFRTNTFKPDFIIEIECNEESIGYCYLRDGEFDKIKKSKIRNYSKFLESIYNKYLILAKDDLPEIIKLNTSFL